MTNVVRVTGGGSLPVSHADSTNVVGSTTLGARLGKVIVRPKARNVRPGRSATFRVRMRNTGDSPGTRARVCLRAAKRFVRVRRGNCRNLGRIRPGQVKVRKFTVRLKGSARNLRRKALPVRVAARIPNATGAKVRRANARIRVVKPRRNR